MTILKILYVEDDKDQFVALENALKIVMRKQNKAQPADAISESNVCDFEIVKAENLEIAKEHIDSSFAGAIIDLKLDQDEDAGGKIIDEIVAANLRIPIFVLSGQPENYDKFHSYVDVLKKGVTSFEQILENFIALHRSGMTNVMGGKGLMEDLLNRVYIENIMRQKQAWMDHGKVDSKRSERALLRHTLNHLIHLVDLDQEISLPEEFYIQPAMSLKTNTGGIVQHKQNQHLYVVMNPMCDLVIRSGEVDFKAKHILLVKIENAEEIHERSGSNKTLQNYTKSLRKNKEGICFHPLPKAAGFKEGFLNFESIQSVVPSSFSNDYDKPVGQISPTFLKDIVAKFSSYLGRQGQPLIHHGHDNP